MPLITSASDMTYLQSNLNLQEPEIFCVKKVDFVGNSKVALFIHTVYNSGLILYFSCRTNGNRSFHCDVCGICMDLERLGNHICREGSGHDECCICLQVLSIGTIY